MISIAFVEKDPHAIVRKAATLIHPDSPYRKCLDMIIAMADAGSGPDQIFRAIDERWGIEYPATNNAVVNGGFVATSVWFGERRLSEDTSACGSRGRLRRHRLQRRQFRIGCCGDAWHEGFARQSRSPNYTTASWAKKWGR